MVTVFFLLGRLKKSPEREVNMQKIYGVEIPEGIEISGYEDLFKWRKPEKDPAKYLDILPSEKAKAYKMRLDAMKSQGKKGSGLKISMSAMYCLRVTIVRHISNNSGRKSESREASAPVSVRT